MESFQNQVPGKLADFYCGMLMPVTLVLQVLDEADRLLTSTFAPELEFLFGVIPPDRQTCLFTATLTPSIESLAEAPPRPGKQIPFIHRIVSALSFFR